MKIKRIDPDRMCCFCIGKWATDPVHWAGSGWELKEGCVSLIASCKENKPPSVMFPSLATIGRCEGPEMRWQACCWRSWEEIRVKTKATSTHTHAYTPISCILSLRMHLIKPNDTGQNIHCIPSYSILDVTFCPHSRRSSVCTYKLDTHEVNHSCSLLCCT